MTPGLTLTLALAFFALLCASTKRGMLPAAQTAPPIVIYLNAFIDLLSPDIALTA